LNARAVHGAFDYDELRRLGVHPNEVLDFSVNANPYGPSPGVHAALAEVSIERYPDRECWQLREAILHDELSAYQLPLASLVCGNGASELIWTITRAFLSKGDRMLVIGPTFGEYAVAADAAGATVLEVRSYAATGFQHDSAQLRLRLHQDRPSLVWLCNPNNPTGGWWDRPQVATLLALCREIDALLVVDESYWHFVYPVAEFSAIDFIAADATVPLIVLRSLTKDFALASARLGYAVGPPELIEGLQVLLPAWNVSGFAQAAGIAALHDRIHLEQTLSQLMQERLSFFVALQQVGLSVLPSHTHFCLIHVGDASFVRQSLLMKCLLVRDCTSFGLPEYIRVATRPASDWRRLVMALQKVVNV
jgi:histidinol-phosphate aminotransferase